MNISEYNQCVKEYTNGVYRFALKSVGDEEEAKDIVQNCFVVLWEQRELVNVEKCKSFLFTVAYRKSMDLHRRSRKYGVMEEIQENGARPTYEIGLKMSLDKALANLQPEWRNLVMLKDVEGYSYEEIAQLTELSLSQVKVYLFRARKVLQSQLAMYKFQ